MLNPFPASSSRPERGDFAARSGGIVMRIGTAPPQVVQGVRRHCAFLPCDPSTSRRKCGAPVGMTMWERGHV